MLNWFQYRDIRRKWFDEFSVTENWKNYKMYEKFQENYINPYKVSGTTCTFSLAPLPTSPQVTTAVPVKSAWFKKPKADCCIQEEGKTPMRYNDNYACASVTAPQSDTAVQRDYLLSRLAKADYPKERELTKLFNIYVDNSPRTYKDLIDAIKNDKFTIDKKVQKRIEVAEEIEDEDAFHFGGPFYGIIWSGPQADRDGFTAAVAEKNKQSTAAKDVIMTGDAAAGLKALQDFEAWLPEVGAKPN